MRWDRLFADLEAQAERDRTLELQAETEERTRAERASTTLASRLRASTGEHIVLDLRSGRRIAGTLAGTGAGWLMVGARGLDPTWTLVVEGGIGAVRSLPFRAADDAGAVHGALGPGHVLRTLSRDRSLVTTVADAGEIHGMIGAVGRDHVDVVAMPGRDVRGAREVVTVPFAALQAVIAG